MTKAHLAQFVFRSIQFTLGGESCIGFINHDPECDTFGIVYTSDEKCGDRRRILALNDDLTARITYDSRTGLLIME